jgi:hypothetical protein
MIAIQNTVHRNAFANRQNRLAIASARSALTLGLSMGVLCSTTGLLAQQVPQSSVQKMPSGPRPVNATASTSTNSSDFASDNPQLPKDWQNLGFAPFVDMVVAFYKIHGTCSHCAPVRQQITANAWERFLGDDKILSQLVATDHVRLIALVTCVGGGLMDTERQQLSQELTALIVDDPSTLGSLSLGDVITLDRTLNHLSGGPPIGAAALITWVQQAPDVKFASLTPPDLCLVSRLISFDHSISAIAARTKISSNAWTRFFSNASYTASADKTEVLELTAIIGRDLPPSEKTQLLAELVQTFGSDPAQIAALSTKQILRIKSAYRAVDASDQQITDLIITWASNSAGWDAELNPSYDAWRPTVPTTPAANPAVQSPPSFSTAILSLKQGPALDWVGLQQLVAGIADPKRMHEQLVARLVHGQQMSPEAAKVIAHSAAVAGELQQWIARLDEAEKSAPDNDTRVNILLARSYAKAAAAGNPSAAEARSDIDQAMTLTSVPSVRFACLQWLVLQNLWSGQTQQAKALFTSHRSFAAVPELADKRELLSIVLAGGTAPNASRTGSLIPPRSSALDQEPVRGSSANLTPQAAVH